MTAKIWLTDDQWRPRTSFVIGETVFVTGQGLGAGARCRFLREVNGGRGVPLIDAEHLRPGAYQFVARVFPPAQVHPPSARCGDAR